MSACGRGMRLALLGCLVVALPVSAQGKVDFAHEVVPLLKARCAECHTGGKYKGSFSLDTREDVLKKKAVVPGKSALSSVAMLGPVPSWRLPGRSTCLTESAMSSRRGLGPAPGP